MLRRWFVEDKGETNAYQWDEDEAMIDWLEKQKNMAESEVNRNINAVRKDAIIHQFQNALEVSQKHVWNVKQINFFVIFPKQECPEVALDAVVGLCQALLPAQRGQVVRTLAQIEFENKERGESGHSSLWF